MWKSCGQTVEVFHNSQNIHDPATKSRRANEKSSYFSDSFLSETHFLKNAFSDAFVSDTFLSVNFTHWTYIWHKYLTHFGDFWVFFLLFFCFFLPFLWYRAPLFEFSKKMKIFRKVGVFWRVLACCGAFFYAIIALRAERKDLRLGKFSRKGWSNWSIEYGSSRGRGGVLFNEAQRSLRRGTVS